MPTWSWAFWGASYLCQALQTISGTRRLVLFEKGFIQPQIMKNPAHREDVAVQPGLQGNHQSGKPPLKHAQVRIGLPNHFLMCRNSIQEPDLWRRVCQRAGAVLRWIWTNSHCGFHYLWHECHHDFREGSHNKDAYSKSKFIYRLCPNPSLKSLLGASCPLPWTASPGSASAGRGRSTWMRATGSSTRA